MPGATAALRIVGIAARSPKQAPPPARVLGGRPGGAGRVHDRVQSGILGGMTDNRVDPPFQAGERPMLEAWLDYHRGTLARKCAGLSDEQLRERAVPPSTLSLLGLVRHMADVERNWFRRVLGGEDAPPLYWSEADPDGDFDNVDTSDVAEGFERWREECEHARQATAAAPSLDVTGLRRGTPVSLRWILIHMIEEYARHNGHADLLRERIDGTVGE
jgi:uncharacterized damage-inducible protein DinB